VSFLDRYLRLNLDLTALDVCVEKQNRRIAQLREEDEEINKSIGILENGASLSDEEQLILTQKMTAILEDSNKPEPS